ncbi:MAGa7180 family putative nuclease [Mycoplasmopsis primatum]|uniref:MAGa7180 family putative nuclease n=1 Tax=Mycoplasmopsis primatum TaxID=55604 RepID=UPI00049722EC|nr:hypothetical protein [Mycoplasmopsis primatum]
MPKYYNGTHYILDEKNQCVILKDEFQQQLLSNDKFKKFKKMGGSSIGNILTPDRFNTEFKAFCHIARLALPVLQKKYVNAGVILEPKIIEYLQSYYDRDPNNGGKIEHIEASAVGYDYFADIDIIGGVPDALDKKRKRVYEIKTAQAKKYDEWKQEKNPANSKGIPKSYKKQAQLYTSLLGYDEYAIVACFLEEEDYVHPDKVDLSKRKIECFLFKVKGKDELIAQIEDDKQKIIDFHQKYSLYKEKVSPKYDLINDIDQVEYLRCKNEVERKKLFNNWKSKGKIDDDIDFASF